MEYVENDQLKCN